MEHGEQIDGEYIPQVLSPENYIEKFCDQNSLRFVGWNQNQLSTGCLNELFSKETVQMICRKITELTMGIGEDNRPIIVPVDTVCSVMSDVYINQRPKTGDIYSRYIIPSSGLRNDVQEIIDKTIEIIYKNIKTSMGMEKCNSQLSIWDSVYGEGNRKGLQAVPRGFAKVAHKRPMVGFIAMKY